MFLMECSNPNPASHLRSVDRHLVRLLQFYTQAIKTVSFRYHFTSAKSWLLPSTRHALLIRATTFGHSLFNILVVILMRFKHLCVVYRDSHARSTLCLPASCRMGVRFFCFATATNDAIALQDIKFAQIHFITQNRVKAVRKCVYMAALQKYGYERFANASAVLAQYRIPN